MQTRANNTGKTGTPSSPSGRRLDSTICLMSSEPTSALGFSENRKGSLNAKATLTATARLTRMREIRFSTSSSTGRKTKSGNHLMATATANATTNARRRPWMRKWSPRTTKKTWMMSN